RRRTCRRAHPSKMGGLSAPPPRARGGRTQGATFQTGTSMRTRKLLIAVAALAVLGQSVAGQGPQAPATSALPKVEFTKFTLPNGLDVIFHVDRKLPIVHINQWLHVGSKDERPGRTGFAHLFEHMMFQGSKNASDD